jgi:hypothetical protein
MVRGLTDAPMTVPFYNAYIEPVVIVKPLSNGGKAPATARVTAVGTHTFTVRTEEWPYLDGDHSEEWAFYLVVEAGQHTVGGLLVEADTQSLIGVSGTDSWTPLSFSSAFTNAPGLFTGVQTSNESDAVVTRLRNVSTTGFEVLLSEQEASPGDHAAETVGWVAIEPGTATSSQGRAFDVFAATVDSTPGSVAYPRMMPRRFPVVVVDVQTANSAEALFPRFAAIRRSSIELFLAEEESFDAETDHVDEECAIFVGE